jgi:putative FmdB family regulatory protein
MPIYEYQCQSCGHRSEALQGLKDPPLTTCTECGGVLRKLVSSPAFQFKGTGWYVTDYAGKDGGKGAAKEGGAKDAGKSAEKGSETSTDKADKVSADGSGKSGQSSGQSAEAPKAPVKSESAKGSDS